MVEKKNLERLLQILPTLLEAKGNEWFKEELVKLVGINNTLHAFSESSQDYLVINPNALLIDYSSIPNAKVQTQLISDCFEMARHRLGRANHQHQADFDEFCRYAHFQIEELINYFYEKIFSGDLRLIKNDIIQYNSRAQGKIENCHSLSKIGHIYKVWALKNKFSIPSDIHNAILRIAYIRNGLSHRTSLSSITSDEKLEQYQVQNGPIQNFFTINEDEIRTILFQKNKDWDEVYQAIIYLKDKIESRV